MGARPGEEILHTRPYDHTFYGLLFVLKSYVEPHFSFGSLSLTPPTGRQGEGKESFNGEGLLGAIEEEVDSENPEYGKSS